MSPIRVTVLTLALWMPLVLSASNLLPVRKPWLELNLALSVHYLLHHVLAVPVIVVLQRAGWIGRRSMIKALAACLVLIGVGVQHLEPFYGKPRLPARSAETSVSFRMLYANVLVHNADTESLRKLISIHRPELIGLVEVDTRWIERLSLGEHYPFRAELPRSDAFGLALYSTFPFAKEPSHFIGEYLPPVLRANVVLREDLPPVTVAVVHALKPFTAERHVGNQVLLRRLATELRHSTHSAIVAADLNGTPQSRLYRSFVWGARLRNAFWGRGYVPTWDARNWLTSQFVIDYVLYKGQLRVRDAARLESIGSDHSPLLVSFEAFTVDQSN